MQDFRTTKLYIISVVIALVLYFPITEFVSPLIPFDKWLESRREAKQEAERQAFEEEFTRKRAERKETDNNIVKTPHGSPVEPVDTTDRTSTESTNVTEPSQNSSDPPSRLLPNGPYKGMTPEEIQVLEQQKIEFILRDKAHSDKVHAAWDAYFENTNDRKLLMLSVFKSLLPEQLESLREEALKTLPEEDVNYFFDDLENKGTVKTSEELIAEGERILISDEVLDNIFIELAIEEEELKQEYKELFGEESYNEIYGDE